MEPIGLTIAVNGLHHRVWHWASLGPALVVVHGITSWGRAWDFAIRHLHPEWNIYAVDLRGHGQSDKPERGYQIADYARDVVGVIEALGITPTRLVGHSLGGAIGARVASLRPDLIERLVLVDPANRRWDGERVRAAMEGFIARVRGTREGGVGFTRANNPHWTDEQVAARVAAHQALCDQVIHDVVENPDPRSFDDDLPAVTCPTLLLNGDSGYGGPSNYPGIVPPDREAQILALLKDGRAIVVPRAGHLVPWDNFEGFLIPLRLFLR